MKKPIIVITIGRKHYPRMINEQALTALAAFAEVVHHPGHDPATKEDLLNLLPRADGCITSWEVAPLDEDVIGAAPNLKAMAHMGGSVKRFLSEALWQKGVRVFSAAPALARDVAQTAVGLMIVGVKRIWPLAEHIRNGGWRDSSTRPAGELHHKKVGIIGASRVGRQVIKLLKLFGPDILLYDPFVSQQEGADLGVLKVELDELLKLADVVSLHAPLTQENGKMLNAKNLALMKDDALLINTARGALIDETALIEELARGRFFAFLDVTEPEPPAQNSPLRRLNNVVVTPHIAGCIEDCSHMSELAVEELRRFFGGEDLLHEITPDMFSRIA